MGKSSFFTSCLAIETAIGGAMQNIVVDSPEVGKAAIEMLKSRDAGRGTFLPISSIRGGTMARLPDNEQGIGNCFGVLRFSSSLKLLHAAKDSNANILAKIRFIKN